MLKKIISLTLILVCMLSSIGFAEKMTDSRGYMRNGKLEEYDRRAKEANSAGFDKRGYYIAPYYRNEFATGLSEEEWDEVDKNTPSLYFYPDGTPKPGTFSTPEEDKAHEEELKRLREERNREYLERQKQREREKEERQRRDKESRNAFFWVIFGTIAQLVGLRVLAFIMRKISDYEERKKLEKRHAEVASDNKTNSAASKTTTVITTPTIMQGPITKEWYKSVGVESVYSEPENDDIVEDTSVFISSSDAFLEDCGTYYDGSEYEVSVPKVNHYLPKPAKDDYKRPVAKKSPAVSKQNDKNKLFVEVKFPSSNKVYDYICELYDIKLYDYVLVPAGNEQKEGKVVGIKYRTFEEMPLPAYRYKKVIRICNDHRVIKSSSPKSRKEIYEEKRCISVIFRTDGNEYNYVCDDEYIGVDDFVIVKARGKETIAKVTDVYEEVDPKWKPIVRAAYSWEIAEAQERFDEFYNFYEADRKYNAEQDELARAADECSQNLDALSASLLTLSAKEDEEDDYNSSYKSIFGYESMTDERGYMRNGKAEEYEAQMRKAERLGRLTDDRGFMIDPYYAQRLRENFAYEEMYSNGEVDEEESCDDD